jgi:hypothetical protein
MPTTFYANASTVAYLEDPSGANIDKTRGAAIKNQLNTEMAACDKKQKEQEHKHAHDASHGVQGALKNN